MVHCTVARAFVQWLRDFYVPQSLGHALIDKARVARVLGGNDPDAVSYAVQYECPSLADARRWHDSEGAALRHDMHSRWGQKALFFTTYLEVLEDQVGK